MEEGKKMDYRIAICDDRQEDREYVRQLTARWAQQRGNQVEMTEFCSAEQFLFSCPQPDFDLFCCWILRWERWTASVWQSRCAAPTS